MKKITLLLLFVTSFGFSQEKVKAYIQKTEVISFEQYDLIKKVNEYYPDILVSKEVKTNLVSDLTEQKYLDTDLVYTLPTDCKVYSVKMVSTYLLNYDYILKDDTYISGSVRLFNGNYIRTLFKSKGNTRIVQYFINGKLINEVKS
ncbi:hypothetical protein [Flavobacterium daejeonense]|uniref:hypothetical protein n=1 Tax=Flavobacterium daejeonense TaxID=350893 RepID=UPI00047C787B|nr:hypothetical protein [Flavobacterium daejeonense]